MHNVELRQKIRASHFFCYEIAAAMGISEYTFSKWLRRELTDEQRERVYAAIEALKGGEACG